MRVQLPLVLGDDSEPEPDVALVKGEIRDHVSAHPSTALLLVEVVDARPAFDRTTKASLYASAGIPEYWIVNLLDRVLEVHREAAPMADQPFGHHYRSVTCHAADESITPLAASGAAIRVPDLVP